MNGLDVSIRKTGSLPSCIRWQATITWHDGSTKTQSFRTRRDAKAWVDMVCTSAVEAFMDSPYVRDLDQAIGHAMDELIELSQWWPVAFRPIERKAA